MSKQKPTLNSADTELLSKFFPTKEEFEDLKQTINHLPTKDQFYTKMDEVVGELKATREDNEVLHGQVKDHQNRLEVIEDQLQISPT